MLISGKFRNRDVQITTQYHESIVDDRRNETEIRIFLRQNLPNGLRIQPELSVDRKIRHSAPVEFKTGIEKFDNNLYIAAIDVPTAKWFIASAKARAVMNKMLKEHSTSKILGRSVMLRRNGYHVRKFDEALIEGFQMAEALDEQLLSAWKQCQSAFNMQNPIIDANGYPRIEGKVDEFAVRAAVNQGEHAILSVRVELGPHCSKDLELCGLQSDRMISRSPMTVEGLDDQMVIGLSAVNSLRIILDPNLQQILL